MTSNAVAISARRRADSAGLSVDPKLPDVMDILRKTTAFAESAVVESSTFFFKELGLPKEYFDSTTTGVIANHIASLTAARELAKSSGRRLDIQLQQEEPNRAFFAARSTISTDATGHASRKGAAQVSPAVLLERFLETKYLNLGENTRVGEDVSNFKGFAATHAADPVSISVKPGALTRKTSELESRLWRLQCFRSKGVLADGAHMRLYFLQQPEFPVGWQDAVKARSTKLSELADPRCLTSTDPDLLEMYSSVVAELADPTRLAPSIRVRTIKDVSVGEDTDVAAGVPEGSEVDAVLLVIGHRAGTTHSYFTGTPSVYRWYGMYAVSKHVEILANGVILFAFKLRRLDLARAITAIAATPMSAGFGTSGWLSGIPSMSLDGVASGAGASTLATGGPATTPVQAMGGAPTDRRSVYTTSGADAPTLADRVSDMVRDVALHFALPRTSITPLLDNGTLSAQEAAYAYCAWKFAFTFLGRSSVDFNRLIAILKTAPGLADQRADALGLVSRLRKTVQSHSFTETQILEAIFRHPTVVAWLYDNFASLHKPHDVGSGSGIPIATPSFEDDKAALSKVLKASDEDDVVIFTSFLTFNHAVLKTNFYRSNIVALSFRLRPSFLSTDYPSKPHGIFYVIGAEFRGFHTRFADVARGGIRLIKSRSPQEFTNNLAGLFTECYNLASTQQRKNKDIPEGGSKGVILLNLAHQDKARIAFAKYVDSIMDVLLPNAEVVDRLGEREILFFGPDENTSDFMDFACEHARARGYLYWKAFTTGKSQTLGGIPHDLYGMTTRGVRAYVQGLQSNFGLNPAALTKMQTGGPDGDLGSNEIKLGNEKTIAVVDGSGVLYDPAGIDHEELVRLASSHPRLAVEKFDRSKLSSRGFLVLVSDSEYKLPDGTVVANGATFRNMFHLNAIVSADFFVPCGGRPQAVNADNVEAFLYGAAADGTPLPSKVDEGGRVSRTPRFKYIVEGANLFFSEDARLVIEGKGVVLFKDSSANKGGVTSSSLEVLAALALTDDEFAKHMCLPTAVHAHTPTEAHELAPAFYKAYVAQVQAAIETNAMLEFECLWAEHLRTKTPISTLSDALSVKITELSTRIEQSDSLWHNVPLRTHILREAIPTTLAGLVGGADVIIARLPENYLRALFGSRLASRFIYRYGLATAEFSFYEYVDRVMSTVTSGAGSRA